MPAAQRARPPAPAPAVTRQLARMIVAVALWLALTSAAFAHASLIAAAPAQDAVLGAAPAAFTLTFSEPVSPLALSLVSPDGAVTPLTRFDLADGAVQIAAPKGLGQGTFVLSYRVISTDGHPVAGSIIFSIGAPSAGGVAAAAPDWQLVAAIWIGRVLMYAGLFFGIGGVFFRAFVSRHDAGRTAAGLALVAGLVGATLSIGLQGLDALGLPLAALGRGEVWATGFSTSLGPAAAIALAGMALAALSLRLHGGAGRLAAGTAFMGIGLALAVTGHASAADPQWLTRPAVFLHATAIAFWAGALPALASLLRQHSAEATVALRRFSRAAPLALLPLVLAGAALALVQVGTPEALIETAYGRVLLVKLSLLVALFGLAAFNRWRLTRPVTEGDLVATRTLIRVIAVETVLIVAVLGAAATWRFTPPPRTLALAQAAPLAMHIHAGKAMAEITFASGHIGENSADILLLDSDFGALDADGVTLVASNPALGVEEIRYPADRQADGTWKVARLTIPVPGTWTVRLDIRVSEFELVRLEDEIAF